MEPFLPRNSDRSKLNSSSDPGGYNSYSLLKSITLVVSSPPSPIGLPLGPVGASLNKPNKAAINLSLSLFKPVTKVFFFLLFAASFFNACNCCF